METRKTTIPNDTVTRNLSDIDAPTGNIYKSVVIIGKRASQIAAETKQELNRKLTEFAHITDNLEETFENREQIEISRYYERLPKAVLVATEDFLEGRVRFEEKPVEQELPVVETEE